MQGNERADWLALIASLVGIIMDKADIMKTIYSNAFLVDNTRTDKTLRSRMSGFVIKFGFSTVIH